MSPADWRALIEAFLDGRLSAEAFERRFMEAWRARRDLIPPAVETLYHAVAAFAAQQAGRTEYDADETDLRQAARAALNELREDTGAPTRTYDRARAREEMRRFEIRMNRVVSVGCLIICVWLALVALQWFAVADQIRSVLGWSTAPAAVLGFFVAFVPILGNAVAFFGATDVWQWPWWVAALVFFAAPAATFLSGWRRWRRR